MGLEELFCRVPALLPCGGVIAFKKKSFQRQGGFEAPLRHDCHEASVPVCLLAPATFKVSATRVLKSSKKFWLQASCDPSITSERSGLAVATRHCREHCNPANTNDRQHNESGPFGVHAGSSAWLC
jgi:hypothetical protein